jgi:tRNA 2-thiouridine synthesizing protein A
MSEETLDARNLLCPLPVIRTQNRVESLQPGDILSVICTDHGVINDIPAWCRINGHRVISINEGEDEIVVELEVGDGQ